MQRERFPDHLTYQHPMIMSLPSAAQEMYRVVMVDQNEEEIVGVARAVDGVRAQHLNITAGTPDGDGREAELHRAVSDFATQPLNRTYLFREDDPNLRHYAAEFLADERRFATIDD